MLGGMKSVRFGGSVAFSRHGRGMKSSQLLLCDCGKFLRVDVSCLQNTCSLYQESN